MVVVMDPLTRAIVEVTFAQLARTNRSRAWLAAEMGMSPLSLWARLHGWAALYVSDVDKIATAFDLSIFELLDLVEAEQGR